MSKRSRERTGGGAGLRSSMVSHSGGLRGKPVAARRTVSPWEWAVAVAGALLVAAAAGYLLWHSLAHEKTPPQLTVAVQRVVAGTGGYTVTFRVLNAGTTTAAALTVRGTLSRDGGTVEEGEAQIDYVAPLSAAEGGLVFTRDPAQYELKLRAVGYSVP